MFKAIEQESSRVMKDSAAVERRSMAQRLWRKACETNTFNKEEFEEM